MKKKEVLKQIKNNATYVSTMLNVVRILEERVSALEVSIRNKEDEPNLEMTKEWVEDYAKACEGKINGETVKFGDSVVDDINIPMTNGIREKIKDLNATLPIAEGIVKELAEEFSLNIESVDEYFVYACMQEYHKQMMGLICQ